MFKWIKNLFVSKRLRAANERIRELEAEVTKLTVDIRLLEDTFLPETTLESYYAAMEPQLSKQLLTNFNQKVFRLLELTFNKSKQD